MFTKNFNSLPDSLIEASKKIMTEASNEAPNIQRLTLTQEEISSINELMSVAEEALNEYVVNQAAHEKITKERDAGNEAMKVAHNAPDRAYDALSNLHDRLSSAHPEQKVAKAHLASAIDTLKRAKNAPNDKERAQHLDNARDAHQKAHELLGKHLQNNAHQLSRQGIHTEETVNEISVGLAQRAKAAATARLRNPNVQGSQASRAQRAYSLAARKVSGDVKIRATGNKPTTSTSSHSGSSTSTHSSGTSQHAAPYKSSYSMIKEPPDRSKGYGSSMPQRAAASPVREMAEEPNEEVMPKGMSMKERTAFHMAAAAAAKEGKPHFEFCGKKYPATMSKDVASKMNEEQIEEALSPEAKKRRDELKAKVRAAKDAYKDISKQAKSPKSGLASLKTPVTPKEHESEDPEESARKHPIDRLRRIALSMKGGHFEYDNGERHPVSRDVARAIVKHYELPSEQGGLKPYQKEKLQSDITKSHDHLMKHYNSISGTNEAMCSMCANETKKLDEVPVETIKQVRTFNVEETDDETPPFEPDKKKVNWKGSPESRATWLAKRARDTMKKQMKTEQVKPGGDMAPKIQVPEGKIVNMGTVHNPERYPNAIPDPTGNLQRAIRKLAKPQKRSGIERSDSPTSIQTRIGEEPIDEREMTKAEMKKREKIVMKLKDKMAGFEKNYAERAKDVMYATATKMAMKGKDNK